jgi:hypothetical protein
LTVTIKRCNNRQCVTDTSRPRSINEISNLRNQCAIHSSEHIRHDNRLGATTSGSRDEKTALWRPTGRRLSHALLPLVAKAHSSMMLLRLSIELVASVELVSRDPRMAPASPGRIFFPPLMLNERKGRMQKHVRKDCARQTVCVCGPDHGSEIGARRRLPNISASESDAHSIQASHKQ